jgi:hypothetical protein
MHKYRIQVGDDMGFLLQGLAETTRGRMSIVVSQWLDIEEVDEESKIFLHDTSMNTARLELENAQLKNQVELLIQKQKSLLAIDRNLEKEKTLKDSEEVANSDAMEMSQEQETTAEEIETTRHNQFSDGGTICEGDVLETSLQEDTQK